MPTMWKNVATWEVVHFFNMSFGVFAVVEKNGDALRSMTFNSVAEARDWVRSDGGWRAIV